MIKSATILTLPVTGRHAARSGTRSMNEITGRDIYGAEFAETYTWESFQVRLAHLRNGWRRTHKGVTTEHPPRLQEGRDWRRIGTTIVYTAAGRRRVIAILRARQT